jgi:hypothetical protein
MGARASTQRVSYGQGHSPVPLQGLPLLTDLTSQPRQPRLQQQQPHRCHRPCPLLQQPMKSSFPHPKQQQLQRTLPSASATPP